jgi:hypothetical protein
MLSGAWPEVQFLAQFRGEGLDQVEQGRTPPARRRPAG